MIDLHRLHQHAITLVERQPNASIEELQNQLGICNDLLSVLKNHIRNGCDPHDIPLYLQHIEYIQSKKAEVELSILEKKHPVFVHSKPTEETTTLAKKEKKR